MDLARKGGKQGLITQGKGKGWN